MALASRSGCVAKIFKLTKKEDILQLTRVKGVPVFSKRMCFCINHPVNFDEFKNFCNTTRFSHITTLLINLDNGPESHSRRTQFMQRLVEFVQRSRITIRLASYPPYHEPRPTRSSAVGAFENSIGMVLCSIPSTP